MYLDILVNSIVYHYFCFHVHFHLLFIIFLSFFLVDFQIYDVLHGFSNKDIVSCIRINMIDKIEMIQRRAVRYIFNDFYGVPKGS